MARSQCARGRRGVALTAERTPRLGSTRSALRGLDVKAKRVLDIGCRDGLYALEAERTGTAEATVAAP